MDVSASPPWLQNSRDTNSMTNAVITSVIHRQRAEDEAAASSTHSQEDKLPGRQSPESGQGLGPLRTGSQESEEAVGNDSAGAGPRIGQNAVVPVETHTWEEVEGAVWQSIRGTSDGAMGYALAILDRIRTDVEERF